MALSISTPLAGVGPASFAPIVMPEIDRNSFNQPNLNIFFNTSTSAPTHNSLISKISRLSEQNEFTNFTRSQRQDGQYSSLHQYKHQPSKKLLSKFDPSMLTRTNDGFYVFNNITLKVCINSQAINSQ